MFENGVVTFRERTKVGIEKIFDFSSRRDLKKTFLYATFTPQEPQNNERSFQKMKKILAVCGTAVLGAALFAAPPAGRPAPGRAAGKHDAPAVKPAPRAAVKPAPRAAVKPAPRAAVKPAPRHAVKPAPRAAVKAVPPRRPHHAPPPPPRPWWKFW